MLVAFCAVPLTAVSTITLTLVDQDEKPLTTNAAATFYDADKRVITRITLGKFPSWENNIHWWAHSTSAASLLRPSDARSAVRAVLEVDHCVSLTIPIALTGEYIAPSAALHGGGSAYMLYNYAATVHFTCAPIPQ
jgi:hypothetical protein